MNRFHGLAFESRGLNGTYCALRSIAKHHLPQNKHCESGVQGDVCFIKMAGTEWGETGIAQYADVAANNRQRGRGRDFPKGIVRSMIMNGGIVLLARRRKIDNIISVPFYLLPINERFASLYSLCKLAMMFTYLSQRNTSPPSI